MRNSYDLSDQNFELLKEICSQNNTSLIKFDDVKRSIVTSDINEVLSLIDDEITVAGLSSDQLECNEYGRKLYSLFDELYYQ